MKVRMYMGFVFLRLAWSTYIHFALLSGKHPICVHIPHFLIPFLCCSSMTWPRGLWENPGVVWVSPMADLFLGFWEAFILILTVARLPYIAISSIHMAFFLFISLPVFIIICFLKIDLLLFPIDPYICRNPFRLSEHIQTPFLPSVSNVLA